MMVGSDFDILGATGDWLKIFQITTCPEAVPQVNKQVSDWGYGWNKRALVDF